MIKYLLLKTVLIIMIEFSQKFQLKKDPSYQTAQGLKNNKKINFSKTDNKSVQKLSKK
jgi:hypothetical protein